MCQNGELDPGETDVDCGGPECAACEVGKACEAFSDCTTGLCEPTERQMRKSRFTEEQMVRHLSEADKTPIAQVAKNYKVSEQTIYAWRKSFGGMDVNETKRLKQLEGENTKLKKMLADRMLEIDVLKEINAKSGRRAWSSAAGGVREETRPLPSTSVRAARYGEIWARI